MRWMLPLLSCVPVVAVIAWCAGQPGTAAETAATPPKIRDGNRLTYLDENNPWYPHRKFPKLIEDTAKLPDLVDRRTFNEVLAPAP